MPHQAVIGYFVLGVIGGLLPDIDLPTSVPVRIAFAALAVVAGFLVVFTFGSRYSLVELVAPVDGLFLVDPLWCVQPCSTDLPSIAAWSIPFRWGSA
jgi:hypothetical protein